MAMTVNSFLKNVFIGDQSSSARFSDGSGGVDKYTLVVFMDGHGKLLSSRVNKVTIGKGIAFIEANGGTIQRCKGDQTTKNPRPC